MKRGRDDAVAAPGARPRLVVRAMEETALPSRENNSVSLTGALSRARLLTGVRYFEPPPSDRVAASHPDASTWDTAQRYAALLSRVRSDNVSAGAAAGRRGRKADASSSVGDALTSARRRVARHQAYLRLQENAELLERLQAADTADGVEKLAPSNDEAARLRAASLSLASASRSGDGSGVDLETVPAADVVSTLEAEISRVRGLIDDDEEAHRANLALLDRCRVEHEASFASVDSLTPRQLKAQREKLAGGVFRLPLSASTL